MRQLFLAGFFLSLFGAVLSPANAQGTRLIGYGALTNNDFIDSGRDRWQTGSSQLSWLLGSQAAVPDELFKLYEIRGGAQLISPENITNPSPGDRRYAGALTLGLHTHALVNGAQYSLGTDIIITGPQTGLDGFQASLHKLLGIREPSNRVRSDQISDGVHPTFVGETGWPVDMGDNSQARPFVEVRIGAETLIRGGIDYSFGKVGPSRLRLRDSVTGQRYSILHANDAGIRWVVGGDLAYVRSSVFLPDRSSSGPNLKHTRVRLRSGLDWATEERTGSFFGLTWLSEEFDEQDEGQFAVSFDLRRKF